MNLKGALTMKKKELGKNVQRAMTKRFNKLKNLKLKVLRHLAKENNIKAPYKLRKQQVTGTLMLLHVLFKKQVAHDINFDDDLFDPARGERQPAYVITETKSQASYQEV